MRDKLLHVLGRIRQEARHQRLRLYTRHCPMAGSTERLAGGGAPVVAINMYPAAGSWGGSSVFVHQFLAALRRCGIRPVFDLAGPVDVIVIIDPREDLLNKAFDMAEIIRYKEQYPKVRIIHRINECDQRKASDFMDECLRQANSIADHTVFISQWLQDHFIARWFDPGRSHQVIYNGADPAVFHPIKANHFDGGLLRLVTHHFSAHPMKGFAVYQQVDTMIADGLLPDTELWIIGGRPTEMQWRAARLFAPVAGRELADLLRQCHVYITASLWEPCGMHHVEGAQCGLPLLYHEDGGGIVEAGQRYGLAFEKHLCLPPSKKCAPVTRRCGRGFSSPCPTVCRWRWTMSGRFIVSCLCSERSSDNAGRIGFIVDALLPSWSACVRRRTLRPLLMGWPSNTAGTVMRFGWVAQHVNHLPDRQWIYELYRPWRSYQAVVFIKSMDAPCRNLAEALRQKGGYTVFDANVDYFTPTSGTSYFAGMAATPKQREESCAMASACNAVIVDSCYLREKVLPYNANVAWIPDNVPDAWIADKSTWRPSSGRRLSLLWSGEAVKLFELLRIEPVLRRFREYIRLRLVTGSLDALSRIHEPWQGRLRRLLADLECEVVPFQDIPALLALYDQGGVCISPRFLDNSYNMGHTEWKISLAMARGRVALASPQPSYCDLRERAGGQGVRICAEDIEWHAVLDSMLTGNFNWEEEQGQACAVVRQYYATSVVAEAHVGWLTTLVRERQGC